MAHHLVLGAGGIGRATAAALSARGETVTLASRSGTRVDLDGVTTMAVDATDAHAVGRAADGVATIVNAVSPANYTHWDRDWPPIARALLQAAERSGAGLVTVGNLYGYGQVDAPMTEATPVQPNGIKGQVRARMWADALAAHEAGRIRATELRASDYFGPGAGRVVSYLQGFVIRPLVEGKSTLRLPVGDPHAPHSWTYLADIGEMAAVLATDDRAWGRAWHVPTAPPVSMAEVAAQVAALLHVPAPAVRRIPALAMWAAHVAPLVRALDETKHQFERPFVIDASAAESTFGLRPTPWATALVATVGALQHDRP